MKLYDFLMPREDIPGDTEFFYRIKSGAAAYDGTKLEIEESSVVCFDTFFNCFSAAKYLKYTKMNTVRLDLALRGSFRAELELVTYGRRKTLASAELDGAGSLSADLRSCNTVCFLSLKLTALSGGAFLSAKWEAPDIEAREVKLGVVICTYRREKYVLSNLARICAYADIEPSLKENLGVFVVDNGGTLPKTIENERVTLVENPNLGGSGGFSRGMYEVSLRSDYTHMLLMDDDVVFFPETLQKTASFLSIVKDEYKDACIGAGMMRLDKPFYQHEFGAFWGGWRVFAYNAALDLSKLSALLANERIYKPDYSAWWYMCMPASFVGKYGLSLPFFIKGDDVEYGLRACKTIVMLNGVGVWHEPFNLKFSAELEYYIKRNESIVSALYSPEQNAFSLFRKLLRSTAYQLVCQRYKWAEMYFKAYDDFLKGADALNAVDMEALHKELRAYNTKAIPKSELIEKYGVTNFEFTKLEKKQSPKLLRYTLNGYLIPRFLYKFCKYNASGLRIVDATDLKQRGFFCADKVLIYNPYTESGYFTELEKRQLFVFGFKLVGMFFKLLFGFRKAAASYRGSLGKLASVESWKPKMKIREEA